MKNQNLLTSFAIFLFLSYAKISAQQFTHQYPGNNAAYQYYIKTMGFKGYMMTKAWLPVSRTKVDRYNFDVEWIQINKNQTKNMVLINYNMLEKSIVLTIKEIKLLNKDNSATKTISPQNEEYKELYDLVKTTFADNYFRIADELNFYTIK